MNPLPWFFMVLTAFCQAKDVWYDATGRPVIETNGGKPGELQPKDLIVTEQPLLRVSEAPWRNQPGNPRLRRDERSWWWMGPLWTVQAMPSIRATCLRPCAVSLRRTSGAAMWNFSYQSRGISWSFTPCR